MLHQITWQQYGLFVGSGLLLYFLAVWLLFFRQKPKDELFNKKQQGKPKNGEGLPDKDLLGAAAEDFGVSTLESDALLFGPATETETGEDAEDDALRGLIPDVLEEVKSIVHTVTVNGGWKKDFISLFKLVAAKYGRLKTSHHLEGINDWIMRYVPYDLTEEEVWSLWD